MKRPVLYLLGGAWLALSLAGAAQESPLARTGVVSEEAARVETFGWGRLITYFDADTYSSTDSLTAVAVIDPGKQIHPPHVHSEEEYLMVVEGEGTWSVEGREFDAKAGDILYAAPWDEHGIRNTGTEPLRFVVFKWNPRPVEPMPKPGENGS